MSLKVLQKEQDIPKVFVYYMRISALFTERIKYQEALRITSELQDDYKMTKFARMLRWKELGEMCYESYL